MGPARPRRHSRVGPRPRWRTSPARRSGHPPPRLSKPDETRNLGIAAATKIHSTRPTIITCRLARPTTVTDPSAGRQGEAADPSTKDLFLHLRGALLVRAGRPEEATAALRDPTAFLPLDGEFANRAFLALAEHQLGREGGRSQGPGGEGGGQAHPGLREGRGRAAGRGAGRRSSAGRQVMARANAGAPSACSTPSGRTRRQRRGRAGR